MNAKSLERTRQYQEEIERYEEVLRKMKEEEKKAEKEKIEEKARLVRLLRAELPDIPECELSGRLHDEMANRITMPSRISQWPSPYNYTVPASLEAVQEVWKDVATKEVNKCLDRMVSEVMNEFVIDVVETEEGGKRPSPAGPEGHVDKCARS